MYTGTASGGHYRPMQSPFILLRSSEVLFSSVGSMLVVQCDVLVEVKDGVRQDCVMQSQCFSILLRLDHVEHQRGQGQGHQMGPFLLLPGRTGLR